MTEHEYIKVDPVNYWTGDMELALPIGWRSDDDSFTIGPDDPPIVGIS